jgi:hypothetical protein
MSTPTLDDEIAVWKAKYVSFGLPELMLDEMIAEAKLEWDTEIGYRAVNLYYDLMISILDSPLTSNEFYKVVVSVGDEIIRGILTKKTTCLFATLPAEKLIVQIYRETHETLGLTFFAFSPQRILPDDPYYPVNFVKYYGQVPVVPISIPKTEQGTVIDILRTLDRTWVFYLA